MNLKPMVSAKSAIRCSKMFYGQLAGRILFEKRN